MSASDVSHELIERLERRLEDQEHRIEDQAQRIRDLEAQLAAKPDSTVEPVSETPSRRWVLKGALVAGAAVAGGSALAKPAAAADGGPVIIGQLNNASSLTRLATTGLTALSLSATGTNGTTLGVSAPSTGSEPWAILASASSTGGGTGTAFVAQTSNDGVPIRLLPSGGEPPDRTVTHSAGMFVVDSGGTLWYCHQFGTPGEWRKVSGLKTAGAVHVIDPIRVYDSRFSTPIANGQNRLISVANGIDITTGAITAANVVPAGATSVSMNLAVVNTFGIGFLSVTPGSATGFDAASINWFGSNQVLNNGSIVKLNAQRQLRVWAGGPTDFVIDITSYTL